MIATATPTPDRDRPLPYRLPNPGTLVTGTAGDR